MCRDDRCTGGLRSLTWVPGWDLPVHKAFMRANSPDNPSTADMTTLIDELLGQASRAIKDVTSGPEAFTLLLRLLTTQFDRVGTGEGYTRLHNLGVSTGTPFCDVSRGFRVKLSPVSESERTLVPGVDVVLEVVRIAVNEPFPTLMATLYPGSMATDPKP